MNHEGGRVKAQHSVKLSRGALHLYRLIAVSQLVVCMASQAAHGKRGMDGGML